MAKIWPVYEGNVPTSGSPWAELPLPEVIKLFDLRPDDFSSDLDTPPHFGAVGRNLTFAGYKYVVVEVDRAEARQENWKPGFYKSRIRPGDAFGRLIGQALVSELGKENVIRVDLVPTSDSQGREALKITVVITPEATQRLKNGAVLDALVKLQQRLNEMQDHRIPIVEYATEAELSHDAAS